MRPFNAFLQTVEATLAVSLALLFLAIPSFAVSDEGKKASVNAPGCVESLDQKILQNADSIVIKMNPKGELTFFNAFAEKYFGYPEKEILGKNAIGTIIPKIESSGRDLQQMVQDLFRSPDRHVTNINENQLRDGKRVLVSWVNLPIVDKSGNVAEVLCIGNPLTKAKAKKKGLTLKKGRKEGMRGMADSRL